MKNSRTRNMILCALFVALIIIGAYIKIPIPYVPFTLQFLFVMMAGLLLGPKWGTMSVCIYILLGLIGVPVFTSGGGPSYVLQPTFGYIIGFAVGAFATGKIAHAVPKPDIKRLLIADFVSLLIVYFFGTLYFFLIKNVFIPGETLIPIKTVIMSCVLLPIPGDILLCVLSAFIGKRLIPVINKAN